MYLFLNICLSFENVHFLAHSIHIWLHPISLVWMEAARRIASIKHVNKYTSIQWVERPEEVFGLSPVVFVGVKILEELASSSGNSVANLSLLSLVGEIGWKKKQQPHFILWTVCVLTMGMAGDRRSWIFTIVNRLIAIWPLQECPITSDSSQTQDDMVQQNNPTEQ